LFIIYIDCKGTKFWLYLGVASALFNYGQAKKKQDRGRDEN